MQRSFVRKITVGSVACVVLTSLIGCGGASIKLDNDPRSGPIIDRLEIMDVNEETWEVMLSDDQTKWNEQKKPDYCWAACMQSVMGLQGVQNIPTQAELWEQVVANPMFEKNRDAATFEELLYAFAPEFKERMLGYYVIDSNPPGVGTLVHSLADGEPAIVGLLSGGLFASSGHAYVAHGMDFQISKNKGISWKTARDIGVAVKDGLQRKNDDKTKRMHDLKLPDTTHTAVKVFLYDPAVVVFDAPDYGGGPKEFSIEELKEQVGFSVSESSARVYLQNREDWLKLYDQGPGIYTRNPINPNGKPLDRKTVIDI